MTETTNRDIIREQAAIWDQKAEFWDDYVGPEGNEFHRVLIAPSELRLLDLQPGETVLDIACGNGQFAREMARIVGRVVACDVAPRFIARAELHTREAGIPNVEYHVVDATDEVALATLGSPFDAAVCTQALMDIPEIEPLLRYVARALRPSGRFVFSVSHPAFSGAGASMFEEQQEGDGALVVARGIKVTQYLDRPIQKGVGIRGEPVPHYYFDRPLSELLSACFDAGLVLDGHEEPAFPTPRDDRRAFDWRNRPQIPPVLVARLRPKRE